MADVSNIMVPDSLDALTATAQAATAAQLQQNNTELTDVGYAEAKHDTNDLLTPLPEPESLPGRVSKPRARKSPGSGAKRAESSKRKFICSFSHYGCDVALSSKNEWKRHVHIQHLQLGFYRCDVGACNPDNSPGSTSQKKVYNDFNRKDLFTQHHRRMHKPETLPGPAVSTDPNSSDWRAFEDSLEDVRARCWQERRKPPARSTCGFCGRVFEGEGSWNERMEHVGGHYARDLPENCREEREDEDLTVWSLQQGIIKQALNGRHVLSDQPVTSSIINNTRQLDVGMLDAPPISPTNGQAMEGQFIGTDSNSQNLPQSAYPPINGSERPGSSSGQHTLALSRLMLSHITSFPIFANNLFPDRLEDLLKTLRQPRKPRMSKRLQWHCVSWEMSLNLMTRLMLDRIVVLIPLLILQKKIKLINEPLSTWARYL